MKVSQKEHFRQNAQPTLGRSIAPMIWRCSAIGIGSMVLVIGLAQKAKAQDVLVGQDVAAADRVSLDDIDHSSWNTLLQKYVNERGQVNYQGWKATAADVNSLNAYINHLSSANLKKAATKEGQLAFWINAYNAVTVKGILREYPTKSIRDHTAKLFGYNIWKNLKLKVCDNQVSLDSMEHKVLRKLSEPRIHFAIVCASISCPRLLNEAYTKDNLEDQLVVNTKNFFANSQNFQHVGQSFRVSSILSWFATDFGANQAAQLKTIAPYLPTKSARAAAAGNAVSVSYLTYDWGLNEYKPEKAGQLKRGQTTVKQGSTIK